jgi:2-oxoglutarate dehydrogenase E2 component (dihydrolipoamide succinyltransferase)
MGKVEIILPKMGESVAEASVTSWLKEVGDIIEVEDALLEIATDKVDSEVPSTHKGVLIEKLCKVGDVVLVGAPVAIIEIEGEAEVISENKPSMPIQSITSNTIDNKQLNFINTSDDLNKKNDENQSFSRFYSPLVKKIAEKENVSLNELNSIKGSGLNERVTKYDILNYIHEGKKDIKPSDNSSQKLLEVTEVKSNAIKISEGDEIIEMDRVRKLIAKHMIHSKQIAPHVTSFVETDVTNLVKWRDKIKDEFTKKEGYKITFTPIFIEAIAKALRDFPMVNISIDGDKIIKKKNINIGVAVALPTGNLIVPVIKNADQLNMIGISNQLNDLSNRARKNKLSQEDISGGTFTLTNAGTFGNIMGTPIINQPEVAILAVGVIQKKPAVIETPEGDVIAIRHKMFMSMSYDHRVVDGMLGGSFLKKVSDYLESFDYNRKIW